MDPSLSSLRFFRFLLSLVLLCTAMSGAVLADPVITGISGPDHIVINEQGIPTGSYKYTATVTCGSPPYTYTQYSTVDIPVSQLALSGGDRWGVWLTVTDSAGKQAVWMRPGGVGNSHEFLYLLSTDYTRTSWTKLTEPAMFSSPSGCPAGEQAAGPGSASGSTSGGGNNGGGDDLPLVPIAAGIGVVAVAGIAGARLLGGRSAQGGGPSDPDTNAGTTRIWTDDRGMERTATLQPDGTWISDAGTSVDLGKTDDARRQHQEDLRHSAAQREGQIADDKGVLDGYDKNLDAVRNERSKEFKDFQKSLRDHAEAERDRNQVMSGVYGTQGDIMNGYVAAGAALDKAGDISVNILVKVAPEVGVPLKQLNTVVLLNGVLMSGSTPSRTRRRQRPGGRCPACMISRVIPGRTVSRTQHRPKR